MRRWIIAIVVGAGVITAAAFAYRARNESESADSEARQYAEMTVETGHIREEVTCVGTVESNLDVEIKCKASGEITKLPFDISNPVEKGDLLLELDPVDENRSVRLAEVQLNSSMAKLAQAKQELAISEESLKNSRQQAYANLKSARADNTEKKEKAERMKALLDKKYASPEETETAEADATRAEASLDLAQVDVASLSVEEARLELLRQDIALAESQVESDQIALENAQQRLKETKVHAPMTGVISDRMVQVGQIISSPTNNVSGGTALMTLSDLSRIFVLASIDESDIGRIAVGQRATITVDAFPEMRFRGEVVRVATKGTAVSNVVTFEVKVEILDESREKLRPEMTADVVILCGESDDALLLPEEAVLGVGERKFVLRPAAPGAEPEHCPVTTGLSDGTNIQIVSGLNQGDKVLVSEQPDSTWSQSSDRDRGPGGPPGGMPPGMFGPPPR